MVLKKKMLKIKDKINTKVKPNKLVTFDIE